MENKKSRRYFVRCGKCRGEAFTLSRVIVKGPGRTWVSIEGYETFSHPGVGWELGSFQLKCTACGAVGEGRVEHETTKREEGAILCKS